MLFSSLLGVGCASRLAGREVLGAQPRRGAELDADYTDGSWTLNPYRAAVKRKVLAAFSALNRRDYEVTLSLMADDVHYCFEGQHALGGERFSKAAVRFWFERLWRLLRSDFHVYDVAVSGMPWNTTVVMRFADHVQPAFGPAYVNHGVQVSRLRWGTVVDVYTAVDVQKLTTVLAAMSAAGIAEAAAPPITDDQTSQAAPGGIPVSPHR
jgi:ketosteroid isomerase-like protein